METSLGKCSRQQPTRSLVDAVAAAAAMTIDLGCPGVMAPYKEGHGMTGTNTIVRMRGYCQPSSHKAQLSFVCIPHALLCVYFLSQSMLPVGRPWSDHRIIIFATTSPWVEWLAQSRNSKCKL